VTDQAPSSFEAAKFFVIASEAKQSRSLDILDCFVARLLAMTSTSSWSRRRWHSKISAKALSSGIDTALALVTYINVHRTKLVVSGMQIQAKDQRTLDELAPLMKAYQDAGERFVAAQRQSDRVLQGN
jgi:hypothetical protein